MNITGKSLEILQATINSKSNSDIILSRFYVYVRASIFLTLSYDAVYKLNDMGFIEQIRYISALIIAMTGSILSPVASRAAFMGPGSSGSEIAIFSVLFKRNSGSIFCFLINLSENRSINDESIL